MRRHTEIAASVAGQTATNPETGEGPPQGRVVRTKRDQDSLQPPILQLLNLRQCESICGRMTFLDGVGALALHHSCNDPPVRRIPGLRGRDRAVEDSIAAGLAFFQSFSNRFSHF